MTWIAYAALSALLAGLGAAATERVLRAAGRPGRVAWVAALILSIALPAAALFGWAVLSIGGIALLLIEAHGLRRAIPALAAYIDRGY